MGYDAYDQGADMIWPSGGEFWCNLPGTHVHIVASYEKIMIDFTSYEISICSFAVFGTRYVRDGLPIPSEIDL